MQTAQENNCVYVRTHIASYYMMLSFHIIYLINQIHTDNLWLQFDTKAHFHFIIPIYELLMNYISSYLLLLYMKLESQPSVYIFGITELIQ